MSKKTTAEDVDVAMQQFYRLIVGIVALFLVPLGIYAFYLEGRLDQFEDTLRHSSPDGLQVEDAARNGQYHLTANLVEGQTVYVPAYSHVYHGDGDPYLLAITLSVRNTSMDGEIIVKSVRYFDTQGKEVKSYLKKPVRLPALGTTEVLIERDDASGGSGANFLVEWYANRPVTEPIIEAVMIDTKSQQGISFARRGSVINEVVPRLPVGENDKEDSSTTELDTSE